MKKNKHKIKPSDYIYHFPDLPKVKDSIFLVLARVSSPEQEISGYLDSQIYRLQKFIKKEKLQVAFNTVFGLARGAFWTKHQIHISKYFNPNNTQKPHYSELFFYTLMFKFHYRDSPKHLVILVESTDRIIRSDDFDFAKVVPITKKEFKELRRIVHKIDIATIVNPDATYSEVESYRKKNRHPKMAKPDRTPGWRLRRYAEYYPKVCYLLEKKRSYGQIYKNLGGKLEMSVIRYWALKYKKEGI